MRYGFSHDSLLRPCTSGASLVAAQVEVRVFAASQSETYVKVVPIEFRDNRPADERVVRCGPPHRLTCLIRFAIEPTLSNNPPGSIRGELWDNRPSHDVCIVCFSRLDQPLEPTRIRSLIVIDKRDRVTILPKRYIHPFIPSVRYSWPMFGFIKNRNSRRVADLLGGLLRIVVDYDNLNRLSRSQPLRM